MRTRTPLLAVRLDGVSHAFVRGELIDGRGHAGYPMGPDGSTAKVLLLCRPGFLLVDPGTLVLKPDIASIDCMTCLRLHLCERTRLVKALYGGPEHDRPPVYEPGMEVFHAFDDVDCMSCLVAEARIGGSE